MKPYNLILAASLAVTPLYVFSVPITATEPVYAESGFTEIDPGDVSEGVHVYENNEGIKIAEISDWGQGDTLTLFNTDGKLLTLGIQEDPDISTYAIGPWSGSTIPTGISILTPHYSNGWCTASFQVSVQKSPVRINYANNPSIYGTLVTLNSSSLVVPSQIATASKYATASLNFSGSLTQDGYTVISGAFYLTIDIDQSGYTRLSWNY